MSRKARVLIVMAAVAALALALPMSAHALTKYPTRLRGNTGLQNEYIVDRTVPGSAVTTPVASMHLERYYKGAWQNVSGYIRVYRTTSDGVRVPLPAYTKTYTAGRSISFPLSIRGEYEVYYAATTYNKAARRYTTRCDNIVSNFSTPTIDPVSESGVTTFTLSQNIEWNTTDFPNMRAQLNSYLQYYAFDEMSGEGTQTVYNWTRTITRPGTFSHMWTADAADWALPYQWLNCYVSFDDPFISSAEYDHDTYFDTTQ